MDKKPDPLIMVADRVRELFIKTYQNDLPGAWAFYRGLERLIHEDKSDLKK